VAIIGFSNGNEMTLGGIDAGEHKPCVVTALRTFETDHKSMRWLGYKFPDRVERLKQEQEFEDSEDSATPLSFWHNGFKEACVNPDKVIARLI
jgi:hypothetical protein